EQRFGKAAVSRIGRERQNAAFQADTTAGEHLRHGETQSRLTSHQISHRFSAPAHDRRATDGFGPLSTGAVDKAGLSKELIGAADVHYDLVVPGAPQDRDVTLDD